MSHRIITIEREYASGGREIGEMIAERLGIPCYNREILQMASERCNVSMDYLETAEEAAPKSFLYTLMLTSSPTRTIEENLPLSDKVYIIETNIIRELAEKGDCVIVGRCASYILRDLENLFNVFIYADTKSRSERAVQEYHVDERRVEAMLRKIDKRRETFYSINTGGNRYGLRASRRQPGDDDRDAVRLADGSLSESARFQLFGRRYVHYPQVLRGLQDG